MPPVELQVQSNQDENPEETMSSKPIIGIIYPPPEVSDDISIKNIESEDSQDVQLHTQTEPASPSPDIVSGTSNSSICSNSQFTSLTGLTGVKASEFIKNLKWQKTPNKEEQENVEDENYEDSGKKKRRYKRGGFADQLLRLQKREQSDYRVWQHENKDNASKNESSRFLILKIVKFECLFSLQLCECEIASGTKSVSDDTKTEGQLVMFSKDTVDRLKIQPGSTVKLYPPWQELKLKHNGRSVLLCTQYCKVLNYTDDIIDNRESPEIPLKFHAYWNCPCTSHSSTSSKDCPAVKFPCIPNLQRVEAEQHSSSAGNEREDNLHTILPTQKPSSAAISLLESIENNGANTDYPVSFKGIIQRVFCSLDLNSGLERWSLLIEDFHGTMSVIKFTESGLDQIKELLQDAECKVYVYTNVFVQKRTTRDRDPDLFSVIDTAWRVTSYREDSQESVNFPVEDSLESRVKCVQPPGFCYILSSQDDGKAWQSLQAGKLELDLYSGVKISSMHSFFEEDVEMDSRISFCGKVLFVYRHERDGKILYITDRRLQETSKKYLILHVKSCCIFPVKSLMDHNNYNFKDIAFDKVRFVADEYSRISIIENDSESHYLSRQLCEEPKLPEYCIESKLYSLVSVTGTICGVDEDASYTWQACDKCDSDKLIQKNCEYQCLVCQKIVSKPLLRMNMGVFLKSLNMSSQVNIKVELLQNTIESLLPREADEEGYDMSCVLGKHLIDLSCFVVTRKRCDNRDDVYLKEIHLTI